MEYVALMPITFQAESWLRYYHDPQRLRLWLEEYQEVGSSLPFGPNLEAYEALERSGALLIITARRDGELIGYCLAAIHRHLHYEAVCGFEDSYYLTPAERRGTSGYKLLAETLKAMKRRGCREGYIQTRDSPSIAPLLERLGMKKLYSTYSISLEAPDGN